MNINDAKLAALKALGYASGGLNDAERAFYRGEGATANTVTDAAYQWLGSLGYTGSLNNRWYNYLGAEGYTGSLVDRLLQFWVAGGPGGGGGSPASEPTSNLAAGKYDRAMTQEITLSTSSVGASIYYTVDGSTPTTSSTLYTGAIPVDTTTTIKALASGGGFTDSTVFSATYTILSPQLYVTGNGFNTGTSFADTSGYAKTVTGNGGAQTSTARSVFGGSSALFDGVNEYLNVASSADFGYGTGDFFTCGWFYSTVNGSTNGKTIFDTRPDSANGAYLTIVYGAGSDNKLLVFVNSSTRITASSTTSINAWHFWMYSRVSGTGKLYVDGTSVGSWSDTTNYATSQCLIGGNAFRSIASDTYWTGNLSHVYSHKGNGLSDAEALAWYNANVAFAPHPDLLLHMDGTNGSTTFTDSSNSALTVTANGNAQLSTSNPKFGTAAGTFDGNGDYLILSGQAAFAYGSCDFTLEGWINPNNFTNAVVPWEGRPTGTDGAYIHLNIQTDAKFNFYVSSAVRIAGNTALSSGTYTHFALCRKAGTTKMYVGGVEQSSSWADTTVYLNGASRPIIAAQGFVAGLNSVNGLMDEWQSIKGFAKYDGNFTPPTRAFVN